MPRGDRDGSIIITPAVKDPRTKKILEPERIIVRKRYRDAEGKQREFKRIAENRTDARQKLEELRADAKKAKLGALARPSGRAQTFKELADYYQDTYLKPAKYKHDRKIEGLRSVKHLRTLLKRLREVVGDDTILSSITYDDLAGLRTELLEQPVVQKRWVPMSEPRAVATGHPKRRWEKRTVTRERSLASAHRHLQLLRRLLNIAVRKDWLPVNPFQRGDSLISLASENERLRVLSHEEEERLLAVCVEPRAHLRFAVICAIDTALRQNEQFTLTAGDVDLRNKVIRLRAINSKTGRMRIVPITARVRPYLENAVRSAGIPAGGSRASLPASLNQLIFPERVIKAWRPARRQAQLEDVHWHDLRSTGTMRMLEAGIDYVTVMKITGHTSMTTFMKYVRLNPESAQRAGAAMDEQRKRA